jgi:hypothetical protein
MMHEDWHPTDQQLLLNVEGELSPNDEAGIRGHLDGCRKCRARRQELENAIADFARAWQPDFDVRLPPAAGPRALLRVRIAQLSVTGAQPLARFSLPWRFAWVVAAAACTLLALGSFMVRSDVGRPSRAHPRAVILSIPDPRLTPGAAILATRLAVCAQANTKNKSVPVALQRKVFEEYGIAGAEPRSYEVDYLVTPALGGADDIRNLWPHSYSATMWNAQVKDALEDRLREMVCDGSLDLAEAQKEIAGDWIGAYKKYFRTDRPLAEHARQPVQ